MGRRIYWLESTARRMTSPRASPSQAPKRTTVVAERQTAGRGRHGRWFSAGRGAVCIGRPSRGRRVDENPAALLTLASGVAIADAVRAVTGLPAEIKWPNDVLIGGRKLAGILAEAAMQAGTVQFVVVGFGVNLQPAAYPPELAPRVTSIEAETSRPADRALLLAEILAAMGERYADLRAGRFDAILSASGSLHRCRAPTSNGFAGRRRSRPQQDIDRQGVARAGRWELNAAPGEVVDVNV